MARFIFPRQVLLVEIDRRCGNSECAARVRVALTKEDARAYTGFECEHCGEWNSDVLSERDVPDWWEELKITSLHGLRPLTPSEEDKSPDEEPGPVERLSDLWSRLRERPQTPGLDPEDGSES